MEFIIFIALFVIVMIFIVKNHDSTKYDLEVKLPQQTGIGRGKIEFEGSEATGDKIEVKLYLEPEFQNKNIEIFLKNIKVLSIPANLNDSSRLSLTNQITISKPNVNDTVEVRIDGKTQLQGPLHRD